MPIYDYRCDHCGHAFSAVQSFSEGPIEKCPNCGKRPRRLITSSAIVFKGSGWYKTDSRPAQKGSDASGPVAEAMSDSKAETKSETKSDSKSETKSDTKGEPKRDKTSERSEAKALEKPSPKGDAAS